ncbi:MAG: DUF4260 domain-containing protein, partial [Spirochaetota bacterium]|nr:DUF4260 domain-containing protein [Spirochaetota bacterium]
MNKCHGEKSPEHKGQRLDQLRLLMKNVIKIEELAFFGFSMVLFNEMELAWWWFAALILAPDISMLGYLVNSTVGAVIYNLFHHRAVAIVAIAVGYFAMITELQLAGVM